MDTIDLAYVGRGLHEELVAYVADQEGYFEAEKVHVAIRDGIGWSAERLRRGAVIGLGRTLLSRLTDGIGWTALSVSTDHPLFWFLGNAEVQSMADLRGRRLAVHAAHSPPGAFARISCASTAWIPTVTSNASNDIPVTTRWTYGTFGTARSTPLTSAARCRPNKSPTKRGSTCWPGSATTSKFPPWA